MSEKDAKLAAENQQLQTLIQHLNSSEGNSTLLAVIHDLKNLNNKISSDNKHLMNDHNSLIMQLGNLTAQNQQLRNNFTEQITNMETNWIHLNVSRAQWSVDAYCPIVPTGERHCNSCQDGWLFNEASCYAINNPNPPDRKTWEEALEDCRAKGSDVAVVYNQKERNLISDYSSYSSQSDGYWIGLRVEDGRWKWVDGNYLTASSWIEAPTIGHCAMVVQSQGWKSVSCGAKQRWICKKSALSV
ncbi:CD209 antigen-like [Centropristis striata]|uniref:CD209 antigen-like n=1 Tax=Centropristis striata TaxID=184440 RepID=UPI0027E0F161|nr:CD209 antigen-like [Centropristis striata]